jgi:hypothetical protein
MIYRESHAFHRLSVHIPCTWQSTFSHFGQEFGRASELERFIW